MSDALLANIDKISSETLDRVKGMDNMLQTIANTNAIIAKAHSDVGNAFLMMAKTFDKVEERQEKLENTNTSLYKEKGIPPKIFLIVTCTLAVVIVLGAVWVTNTFIRASFTSIEAGIQGVREEVQHGK